MDLLPAAPPPPVQKRDAQQMFLQHRGAHAEHPQPKPSLEKKNLDRKKTYPEGPARHLDVPGQKLSPHCLETIFDSQLPSPKSSPKMPPKLSLPHRRGHFFLFQNYHCGEGNCEAIERQKLSRGNFCPGTSRCLAGPTGYSLLKIT